MGGHRDGLGFHGGLLRDGHGDGGAGGAGGANAAGATLQQLLHVIQLSPCQVRGAPTVLNKCNINLWNSDIKRIMLGRF